MLANNPFDLKLLQAINDWQIKSNTKRGEKLKGLTVNLPSIFKVCNDVCFRKIELKKDGIFSIVGKERLKEKISSWTTSIEVAKSFKEGVSISEDERSLIIHYSPKAFNVILNLEEVYRSECFHEAVAYYKNSIKSIKRGIENYGNSQKEVILEIDEVDRSSIYMVGGVSFAYDVAISSVLQAVINDVSTIVVTGDDRFYMYKWLDPIRTQNVLRETLGQFGGDIPHNVYAKDYGIKYGT